MIASKLKVKNLKVGDKLFNRPITKITKYFIYINPTTPTGKRRYKKLDAINYFDRI